MCNESVQEYSKRLHFFANPSSSYSIGRECKRIIDDNLRQISRCLKCDKFGQIIPTSCSTESNNIIIHAFATKFPNYDILTTPVEHASIRYPVQCLYESKGKSPTNAEAQQTLVVDNYGEIQLDSLVKKLTPAMETDGNNWVMDKPGNKKVSLVTVIWGNNEIGTLQPIHQIADICQKFKVPLHIDATQIIGRYDVNLDDLFALGVTSFSFSSHKFHGPKGCGFLVVRKDLVEFLKNYQLMSGGKQFDNLRPGTENLPAICASRVALEKSVENLPYKIKHVTELRKKLLDGILKIFDKSVRINTNITESKSLYNTLNVCLCGLDSRKLMKYFEKIGIFFGVGSACSKAGESSVLLNIGCTKQQELGAVRLSLSHENTVKEIEIFLYHLAIIKRNLENNKIFSKNPPYNT